MLVSNDMHSMKSPWKQKVKVQTIIVGNARTVKIVRARIDIRTQWDWKRSTHGKKRCVNILIDIIHLCLLIFCTK